MTSTKNKLISINQRLRKISLFLKLLRNILSKLSARKLKINKDISKIEKYSHCVLNYKNKSSELINKSFLNQMNKEFREEKKFINTNYPYRFVRHEIITTKKGSFGYDYKMIEYVNIEDFMKIHYKDYFQVMKEKVDEILTILSELRNKKISIKYVKCYHYKGIIHPRPLHIDTLNDYSYKIFFFIDKFSFKDGGYAIIPGSSNYFINRAMMLYNKLFGFNIWPKYNDGSFYDSKNSLNFCEIKSNQLIITKQNAIHGDLPASGTQGQKTAFVFHCTSGKK